MNKKEKFMVDFSGEDEIFIYLDTIGQTIILENNKLVFNSLS